MVSVISFGIYYNSFPRNIDYKLSNGTLVKVKSDSTPTRENVDVSNNYVYQVNFRGADLQDAIQFCYENILNKNRSCSAMCGNKNGGTLYEFSIEELNSDFKRYNLVGIFGGIGSLADYIRIYVA